MTGRNRFYDTYTHTLAYGEVCVFISHQKRDAGAARKIADYLTTAGIDVYFDEWDKSIDRSNPNSVVAAIQKGLDRSSHLLVLLSSNALASTWVPWEVGYGYHKNVFGLTLKELARNTLPEYLQVIPIVRGTKSLNDYLSKLTGVGVESMIRDSRLTMYYNSYHPLREILDQTL